MRSGGTIVIPVFCTDYRLVMHESGTFVRFTPKGAELFA
jgi:hypothetical protein